MLHHLAFRNVGPAPELAIDFKPRINFITGDNGLGKSFLLDAAWWALTRTWSRELLRPHSYKTDPLIFYSYDKKSGGVLEYTSRFDRSAEEWKLERGRPPIPGLIIYAQVDGGFSVWDPARNYWKKMEPDRVDAYLFEPDEVWGGLPLNEPKKVCNGLIADWVSWQLERGPAFDQLTSVLDALAPSLDEPLKPGEVVKKLSLRDARRHPTISMPYGQDVPLVYASAGIRRVVSLAYLLVWTWQEHAAAADLRGDEPAREVIFLVDEIEAHLHPEWQRRIVPALLDVMNALTGEHDIPVQLIAATHSPMVLASVEAHFDEERDRVSELDLRNGAVELNEFPWMRLGDANSWLTSSVFDLEEPRSIEAEHALREARRLLLNEVDADLAAVEEVNALLMAALSDVDRFWVRWCVFRDDFIQRNTHDQG